MQLGQRMHTLHHADDYIQLLLASCSIGLERQGESAELRKLLAADGAEEGERRDSGWRVREVTIEMSERSHGGRAKQSKSSSIGDSSSSSSLSRCSWMHGGERPLGSMLQWAVIKQSPGRLQSESTSVHSIASAIAAEGRSDERG